MGLKNYISRFPGRSESEPRLPRSIVMYDYKGILAIFTSADRESYDADVAKIESEGREIFFAGYNLSEEQYNTALRELQSIQFRPLSEVKEQIEGLVAKLKEGK